MRLHAYQSVLVCVAVVQGNNCMLTPCGFSIAQQSFSAAAVECSVISVSTINQKNAL